MYPQQCGNFKYIYWFKNERRCCLLLDITLFLVKFLFIQKPIRGLPTHRRGVQCLTKNVSFRKKIEIEIQLLICLQQEQELYNFIVSPDN